MFSLTIFNISEVFHSIYIRYQKYVEKYKIWITESFQREGKQISNFVGVHIQRYIFDNSMLTLTICVLLAESYLWN